MGTEPGVEPTINRRQFVLTSAAAAEIASFDPRATIPKLGIGLFPVRKLLDSEFSGVHLESREPVR